MIIDQQDQLLSSVKKIRYSDDEPIDVNSRQMLNSSEFVELPASIKEFVDLELLISNPTIGLSENPEGTRNCLVKVATTQGGLLKDKCMRAALDLVCVIDTSGSMIGFNEDGSIGTDGKIDRLKATLVRLLDFLTDADRLSLVFFTSKAKRATPLMNTTQANKALITKHIEAIKAGGSTNIFDGLLQGLAIMDSRRDKNQVSSIFLLSDGCDKLSHKILQDTFSKARGYDQFSEISINTFGFGDDDCNLMELIAHKTGGVFYNVEEYEDYIECFVECLGSLLSIIADKAILRVQLLPSQAYPEIHFARILNDGFERTSELEIEVDYKFLISGKIKNFVFSLVLPHSKDTANFVDKQVKIVTANLSFSALAKSESFTISKDLSVSVGNNPGSVNNEEVERQYLRMELALYQKNQVDLVDKGKFEEAKAQEKIFEEKHLKLISNKKNDTLLDNCYAQFNHTQNYVNSWRATPADVSSKNKRKIISSGHSMMYECSNIGNRYYCNQMQANLILKSKK